MHIIYKQYITLYIYLYIISQNNMQNVIWCLYTLSSERMCWFFKSLLRYLAIETGSPMAGCCVEICRESDFAHPMTHSLAGNNIVITIINIELFNSLIYYEYMFTWLMATMRVFDIWIIERLFNGGLTNGVLLYIPIQNVEWYNKFMYCSYMTVARVGAWNFT